MTNYEIVIIKVNHVQGQHPTQVRGKRNVKSKYYGFLKKRKAKRLMDDYEHLSAPAWVNPSFNVTPVAKLAVEFADELIKQLKRKV
nr:MAG TPA: hypothetical protein [Caudoviricetes sp.]